MVLLALRGTFRLLSISTPRFAARAALRLFLTPPRAKTPPWERKYLSAARTWQIRSRDTAIQVYEWGSGPTVLLVHGWGGRATHLAAFIDPLVTAGFRVLSFDGPAHGRSAGKRTDMFAFARAIADVAADNSPVEAVIGYSFGAACTLLSASEFKLVPKNIVLVACPASAISITNDFGRALSIPAYVIDGMRELLARKHGNRWTWEALAPTKLIEQSRPPIFIVHDENDREVACTDAYALYRACPRATIHITQGQGHRGIRRAGEVVTAVIRFLRNHDRSI